MSISMDEKKSLSELQSAYKEVLKDFNSLQKEIEELHVKKELLAERKRLLEKQIEKLLSVQLSEECNEKKWCSKGFLWSVKLMEKLQSVFEIDCLRPKQLETMNATLSSQDVILVMPTGGGKSLCYQLPAVISTGVTLVVSPLVSLMEDQCYQVERFGIDVAYLCADTPKESITSILTSLSSSSPDYKILFVTPEKIAKSKRFLAKVEKCYKLDNLSRIVIDEVHCASQWGNDFRPDYKALGILKRQFPNSPVLGLTATATDKVIADTKKILGIPRALVFKTPLNRPNLFYNVRVKPKNHDDVMNDIAGKIKKNFANESGIVYCFSRNDTLKVSEALMSRGITSSPYHAYMPPSEKSRVHSQWRKNKIQVICSTVAFGMGIDKPDVRFVIHHSLSKSMENYYQESGRAGRDGKPSLCLLYFGFQDIFKQSSLALTEQAGLENLSHIINYCHDVTSCRRDLITRYFGESVEDMDCEGMCDVCAKLSEHKVCDVTHHCRSLLEVIKIAEGKGHRLTGLKLIEAAAGRGPVKSMDKVLRGLDGPLVQRIVIHMLNRRYLREDFHFTPYATVSYLVSGPMVDQLSSATVFMDVIESSSVAIDIYEKLFSSKCHKSMTDINKVEGLKKRKRALIVTSSDEESLRCSTSQQCFPSKSSRSKKRNCAETIVIEDSD